MEGDSVSERPKSERKSGDEPCKHAIGSGTLSRRRFVAGLGAAGAALAVTRGAMAAGLSPSVEEEAEGPTHQWAFIVDLRKCEGCVTIGKPPACTLACNRAHFVPQDQEWIKVYRLEEHNGYSYFLPRICMQCENAPCVNVCPVGASYTTPEGIVLIDHRLCIGCRLCMAACPYGARYFNWAEPENPPGVTEDDYSPEFPVPHRRGTAEKCMLCAHYAREGRIPACAQGCPMKALYLGDLVQDMATNGVEVRKLSYWLAETQAYRLLEELGTRPRVWYIPGHGEEFGRQSDDPRDLLGSPSPDPEADTEEEDTHESA